MKQVNQSPRLPKNSMALVAALEPILREHGFVINQLIAPTTAYTPTNVTPDRAFDADTVVVAELADVVGSLILDLQSKGIIS